MPLTKHLKVAIIDSNPALSKGLSIKKDDPPDPRVSTVTPATISLFKGSRLDIYVILLYVLYQHPFLMFSFGNCVKRAKIRFPYTNLVSLYCPFVGCSNHGSLF